MRWLCVAALAAISACVETRETPSATPQSSSSPPVEASAEVLTSSAAKRSPPEPKKEALKLIAGGDIDLARLRGQVLLRDAEHDYFAPLAPLFASSDVRFANLESTISDQKGETQSSWSTLVFTAPPPAAPLLARAKLDLVSLANNHAWDYGQAGLFETFDRLTAVKLPWVGAGRTLEAAYAPQIVEKNGQRIAFVAVTAIWNQHLEPHPGKKLIADADRERMLAAVKAARALDVDRVVLSFHGGDEYVDQPLPGTRELLLAALDAGADAVIGHHPHVVQRVEIHGGKPIFYSLGNLMMRMSTSQPWTEYGMLARLTFEPNGPIAAEICPIRTFGLDVVPLGADRERELRERFFRIRFGSLLNGGAKVDAASAVELGPFAADGCASLTPRSAP
jgi:poly-gamma-glutamate capsule biosynthesis protein CapA/YwtB (metallophosphatase superfamily)